MDWARFAGGFDDLDLGRGVPLLQFVGHIGADIPAARDHDALAGNFVVPENGKGPFHLVGGGDEIGDVAHFDLVAAFQHHRLPPRNTATTVARRSGKSWVSSRSGVPATGQSSPHTTPRHHDRAVREAHRVHRARQREAAQHGLAHLHFRRNDHIHREMIAREHLPPFRLEIGLGPNARDLGRHIEQGMGHWQATMFTSSAR